MKSLLYRLNENCLKKNEKLILTSICGRKFYKHCSFFMLKSMTSLQKIRFEFKICSVSATHPSSSHFLRVCSSETDPIIDFHIFFLANFFSVYLLVLIFFGHYSLAIIIATKKNLLKSLENGSKREKVFCSLFFVYFYL